MFCLALLIIGLTAHVSSQPCVDSKWWECHNINPESCTSEQKNKCPLSCTNCIPPPGCQDKNTECIFVKATCTSDQLVQNRCKKTCDLCGAPPTLGPWTHKPSPVTPKTNPDTPIPTVHEDCGTPEVQGTRIIGGSEAWLGIWPWQILLKDNYRPSCGGTIINNNWVVTASHCVVDPRSGSKKSSSSLSVVAGTTESSQIGHNGQTYQVSKVISHPSFSFYHFEYDIALLKLSEPIKFNKYVKPACLPTAAANVGKECYITGWGRQSRGVKNMGQRLHQARMPVISKTKCKIAMKSVAPNHIIGDSSLCAGKGKGMVSGCQGDSGGPFVCKRNNKWELHGAVSWGSKQCSERSNQYTVFANINHLRSWIQREIKNN